jgi:hypothetical protein
MMKIESHIPTIVCAALVLVAHASHAQVGIARSGTYIDRTGDNSAEISKSNQIIQTNKAANEADDRREQSRVDSLRANQEREARAKENQEKAANLELEKQMEKTRQETYQYYRNLSDFYYQRAKLRNREKRGKPDAEVVEKKQARPGKDLPGCGIKPVMTDAEIAALRLCR